MNKTFLSSLLSALLLTACAAQSSPAALPPGQGSDVADGVALVDGQPSDAPPSETTAGDLAQSDQGLAETSPADAQPQDSQVAETTADAAKALPNTSGLQPKPLALPEFTQVVDSAGQSVGKSDLVGHYTVLWFYPAASTGG